MQRPWSVIESACIGKVRCLNSFLFALISILVAPACGDVDGTGVYSLWRTYTHPDNLFHFHYMSPPFERGKEFTDEEPVFVIDEDNILKKEEAPGAKARLEAWVEKKDDLELFFKKQRKIWEELGYAVDPPALFVNDVGDEGLKLTAKRGDFWVVQISFLKREDVISLSLWVAGSMDHRDIDLLVSSFEPRGMEE